MKRVLVLALALTLCLGLAATVFAALPSYDVIASRIGVSSSLNENDDIIVDGDLKLVRYLNTEKSIKTTFELPGRWVINDNTKLTVSNLSPADCSDCSLWMLLRSLKATTTVTSQWKTMSTEIQFVSLHIQSVGGRPSRPIIITLL